MTEAAAKLGVSNHRIRRLIRDRILTADQVVPGAPAALLLWRHSLAMEVRLRFCDSERSYEGIWVTTV